VTNGERADRLLGEARQIASEMRRALEGEAWNLATRRAQEVLERAIKALLNEMSVEYPKTHDRASLRPGEPDARDRCRRRCLGLPHGPVAGACQDQGPAFCQETVVTDTQARDWVQRVELALRFGEDLLRRLRNPR
jgi:HEPN domain